VCGIIGYIGSQKALPLLLEALKRLEYRGYDSAGVALLEDGQIMRFRRAGKVRELEEDVRTAATTATTGIGHTRWATHGKPTEDNAHPHVDCSGRIAVVHNGIIENYAALRDRLAAEGHTIRSETDTEVLAHLIEAHLDGDLLAAVRAAVAQAQGAFALAVLSADAPDRLIVARRGSPLVLANDGTGSLVSSDVPALLGRATDVQYLSDNEIAELTRDGFRIFDTSGRRIQRPTHQVTTDPVAIQKAGYKHYMLKEIHEQARAIGETIREKLLPSAASVSLPLVQSRIRRFDHVYLVSCGTAFHASMAAEYLWEGLLPVPIQAMIASEFRVRSPHLSSRTLVVAVSQSGETIDTLMALRHARERGAQVIALVNNEQSAIDREADASVYTRAGIEIGVAATKTFTAQIAALGLLGIHLGQAHFSLPAARAQEELERLARLPGRVIEALRASDQICEVSERIHRARDVLYLARGSLYPVALEGALKLKEISYIHAEGYPAGEMKHGPIALIDEGTPVVTLLSRGTAYDKVLANIEEVKARNGFTLVVTDAPEEPSLAHLADVVLAVPAAEGISRPILFAIPLQLLAYYIAVQRGTDVDQPRNLAKTVTVE